MTITGDMKDRQTVTSAGDPVDRLPIGVTFRPVPTHTDDRGTVFELFDPRWNWHPDPLVFAYCFTLRPGSVKGWGLHRRHQDRYCIMFGEIEVVFYDDRDGVETRGEVSRAVLSHHDRRLMNIPEGVWHALRNLGREDAVVVNFPTIPYDHADPDKYRLPLDTDQIPYRFEQRLGW